MATQNAILQAIAQVGDSVKDLRLEVKGDLTLLRQEFVDQVKLLPTRAEVDVLKRDQGAFGERIQRIGDQINQINVTISTLQSQLSTNASDVTNLRTDFSKSQGTQSRRAFELTQQHVTLLVTVIIFLGGIIGAHLLWR